MFKKCKLYLETLCSSYEASIAKCMFVCILFTGGFPRFKQISKIEKIIWIICYPFSHWITVLVGWWYYYIESQTLTLETFLCCNRLLLLITMLFILEIFIYVNFENMEKLTKHVDTIGSAKKSTSINLISGVEDNKREVREFINIRIPKNLFYVFAVLITLLVFLKFMVPFANIFEDKSYFGNASSYLLPFPGITRVNSFTKFIFIYELQLAFYIFHSVNFMLIFFIIMVCIMEINQGFHSVLQSIAAHSSFLQSRLSVIETSEVFVEDVKDVDLKTCLRNSISERKIICYEEFNSSIIECIKQYQIIIRYETHSYMLFYSVV